MAKEKLKEKKNKASKIAKKEKKAKATKTAKENTKKATTKATKKVTEKTAKTEKNKIVSLRTKLLAVICPLLTIGFLVLFGDNYNTSQNILTDSAITALRQEANATVQELTIEMVTATSASTIADAYNRIYESPSTLSTTYKKIEWLAVLDCGYAFLVDRETGKILAHSDSSIKNSNLFDKDSNSFLGQVAEMVKTIPTDGNLPVNKLKDGSDNYYVITQPFDEMPWVLVTCLPSSYIADSLTTMNTRMFAIVAIILVVTTVVISIVVGRVIAPVSKLTTVLTSITDGDFTVDIQTKGNDEISVMSKALKDFVAIMGEVILDIREVSNQLSNHSETSKKIADTLSETSSTQAESMGDMQITLDQVANAIQELAQHASTLAEVVNNTSQDGATANEKMQQTVTVATQGRKDMEQVAETMSSIVTTMKQLDSAVAEVGDSTKQINSIVQLISEIADQTNLLSLNASIEAARAGDAGRGFSVVAEEIRKLAEISANSATQIADIITKVNSQVDGMVAKTNESVVYIEDNSARITASCEIFDNIYQDVSSTSDVLQHMVEQITQVDDVATNIAALSEEQSASTEEILASTQILSETALQISDDSKHVADSSETVSDASFTLAEHMRRFKI